MRFRAYTVAKVLPGEIRFLLSLEYQFMLSGCEKIFQFHGIILYLIYTAEYSTIDMNSINIVYIFALLVPQNGAREIINNVSRKDLLIISELIVSYFYLSSCVNFLNI